jgi:hypothetical protein
MSAALFCGGLCCVVTVYLVVLSVSCAINAEHGRLLPQMQQMRVMGPRSLIIA